VTDATRRRLAKIRVQRESEQKLQLNAARELAAGLQKVSVTIPAKAGENEKLYGSVTTAEIAEALEKQGVKLDRHCLVLDAPIRSLGVFEVKVKLHAEVEAAIKVWVVEE